MVGAKHHSKWKIDREEDVAATHAHLAEYAREYEDDLRMGEREQKQQNANRALGQ